MLSPSQVALLKLSLSLHIYSPKVQMFQQISTEVGLPKCQCVADIGGKFTCDLAEIEKLVEQVNEAPSSAGNVLNCPFVCSRRRARMPSFSTWITIIPGRQTAHWWLFSMASWEPNVSAISMLSSSPRPSMETLTILSGIITK